MSLETFIMKKVLISAVAAAVFLSSQFAMAASMNAQGNITKVQATPNNKWGGCLVRTDANYGRLNCSASWIAVDCEGVVDGNTKSAGQRRFDVATLAMLTGQRVKMKIFDNVKINGYCYADRVELQPAVEATE